MKKTILRAIVISVLIFQLLVFGTLAGMVSGAPVPRTAYYPGDSYTTVYSPIEIPPPNGTKHPTVAITSPANNTVTASNNLTLTFNLTLIASTEHYPITLDAVYFKPNWQSDNITLEIASHSPFMKKTFPFSLNLTGVPEGNQTITVYAYAVCEYETSREFVREPISQSGIVVGNFLYVYSAFYRTSGSSSVCFTIDPSANEQSTQLPQPEAEGLPTGLVYAAVISIGVAAVSAGLLLYFKKRNH